MKLLGPLGQFCVWSKPGSGGGRLWHGDHSWGKRALMPFLLVHKTCSLTCDAPHSSLSSSSSLLPLTLRPLFLPPYSLQNPSPASVSPPSLSRGLAYLVWVCGAHVTQRTGRGAAAGHRGSSAGTPDLRAFLLWALFSSPKRRTVNSSSPVGGGLRGEGDMAKSPSPLNS